VAARLADPQPAPPGGPAGAPGLAASRIENQVHAILACNLAPTLLVSDLFGATGRHWLSRQVLSADERSAVQALLRQLDFHGDELAIVDRELAAEALSDPAVAHLMTIPGADAISIVAAVGDFSRSASPGKLVAYTGLNPRVRQPGNAAPVHGRISQVGRARSAASWSRPPGQPAEPSGRCVRSTGESRGAAGSRSPWWPPRGR